MSNLSTEVFGDMNYLYEHIANRDTQQLNENSEHYDEEFAQLVEDIFYNISYSMVSEGYSANGILDFLSKASEEDILEKYFSCTISEGLVSEEYIIEQLEIIDEGLGSLFTVLGKGLGMGAKTLAKGTGTALKGTGRTISVATQRAIGPGGRKAIKGAVTKVKDLAKGAKAALSTPTARKIGLGALGAGALVGLPYAGAKLAGAGSDQGDSPTGAKPTDASNADFTKGSVLAKLGGREGRLKDGEFRTMGWSQQSKERYNKAKGSTTPPPAPNLPAPASNAGGGGAGGGGRKAATPPKSPTPKKPDTGKLGGTSFERRTPNRAEFKAAQEYRQQNPNAKPEDVLKAAQEGGKRQKSVDTDIAKFNKPEELNKPAPAGSALAAEQERRKAQAAAQKQTVSSSYEYDAYDLVLEYLFNNGHADTLAEAEYLMTELDESFIQSLVESYEANLLAEEVEAWVNQLVDEGYDLSDYTWDNMVDYYFTEAGRMHSASDQQASWHSQNTGNQSNSRSDKEIENEKGGKEFLERIRKTKKNPKYKK